MNIILRNVLIFFYQSKIRYFSKRFLRLLLKSIQIKSDNVNKDSHSDNDKICCNISEEY